uniref:Uncharacterized protein n=1 Tax=Rhizophora mucronata TaxID=61149 RepID=A0A2P2NBE2_RHIMU
MPRIKRSKCNKMCMKSLKGTSLASDRSSSRNYII